MRSFLVRALGLVVAVLIVGASARASAQSVRLSVEDGDLYAGLPFVLALSAEGFDEEPEPTVSKLEIPGCKVTYLGVSPSVSQSITVINGRRSESRDVTFVYRYRVEAPEPGQYEIAPIRVEQGSASASTPPQRFEARPLADTRDMRIDLTMPDRKVWVGEAFEITIDWLLRRNPRDQSFVIPLFDDEAFTVDAPATPPGARTLEFTVGPRELELPFESEKVTVDGTEYTRFRFRAIVRPREAGSHTLEAPRVIARLQTGAGRDAFGFRSSRYGLFKAEGEPRSLEVAPLPMTGRPASFSGAVGDNFSIKVQASRTVVSLGEPIELSVLLRSTSELEGLALPDLTAAGLPKDAFSVPGDPVTGELSDGGKAKLFKVPVRLTDANVREIPALSFAYFDPAAGEYRTAHSEPVALSVHGSAIVGASDVVGGQGKREVEAAPGAAGAVGAELSLSGADDTLDAAPTSRDRLPWLALLYGLPLCLLFARLWLDKTRGRRGASGAVRDARKALDRSITAARSKPARESGPELVAALKNLARLTGAAVDPELVARIETEAFDPRAAEEPLGASTLRQVSEAGAAEGRRRSNTVAALCLVAGLGAATTAHAQQPPPEPAPAPAPSASSLDDARAIYAAALQEDEREARVRAFARAQAALGAVARENPRAPELLTDWGNAALGAGDRGTAVLAYRRALALDPSLDRARRNLGWLRDRAPEWLPRPEADGAVDSLFFWHERWPASRRHLVAALAFALAVLLVTPWPTRRRRLLRGLALAPALVCVAMWSSLILSPDRSRDVVVIVDGEALRSADSDGAPAALASPIPAGAEATLRETRGAWARVALADGTDGWLRATSVALVDDPARHADAD